MARQELKCPHCGKDFVSYQKDARYCKRECRIADKRSIADSLDENLAIELYESGMTQIEVAEAMGVTRKIIEKFFAKVRKRGYKCRVAYKRNQWGKNNTAWQGGVVKDSMGYVVVRMPRHPRANTRGYVRQHILVMETHIGRPLIYYSHGHPDNEVVHHINHQKDDNRLENLQLMTCSEHTALHNNLRKESFCKRVCRLDTGEVFPSITAAAKSVGTSINVLSLYIRKGKVYKGIRWELVE